MDVFVKNKKRGFTLVEVIVVLVILAILAAVLIPSLTGYIDKARKNAIKAECRSCVTAAQTLSSEAYGVNGSVTIPQSADIQTLAEVKGSVDSVELDGKTALVLHLTYTNSGLTVTYCAYPDTCADHDETFTFAASQGGGSGSGGSSAGTVTVTDSAGKTYTLSATGNWADIKSQITGDGWNITSGSIISDGTGTYICYNWSNWIKDAGNSSLTLSSLAAKYPQYFKSVDSSTKIWSSADTVSVWGSEKWNGTPAAGDLCWYDGAYYVAPSAVGEWTLPPDGWIKVSQ